MLNNSKSALASNGFLTFTAACMHIVTSATVAAPQEQQIVGPKERGSVLKP